VQTQPDPAQRSGKKLQIIGKSFGSYIKSYYLYTMNTTAKEPTVKKRINHDSMWISCNFPSGARFKYRITRYNTTLEFAFSNDDEEGSEQLSIFKKWLAANTTSYGDLFIKLEDLCMKCKSGKQLITKMNK